MLTKRIGSLVRSGSLMTASPCLIFLLLSMARPQTVETLPLALDSVLDRTEVQRAEYAKQFVDLASEEVKIFQLFNSAGSLTKSRTVRSVFFIHRPNNEAATEFRNVTEIDGKVIKGSASRTETFFRDMAAINNTVNERQRVYQESLRYDIGVRINGMTLHPAPVLERRVRPYFKFTYEGEDRMDGRPVSVIAFRQDRDCPYIAVNKKKRSTDADMSIVYSYFLKDDVDYRERLVGKLWIDRETFQIRKEERNMLLQPDLGREPFVFVEDSFTYQNSEFGILTPKVIVHQQYRVADSPSKSSKYAVIEFRYDRFTRPHVSVEGASREIR